MRQIGHIENETDAQAFSDYLYVQGIENQLEAEKSHWIVWIHDEEKLAAAAEFLKEFRVNPGDPKFRNEGKSAAAKRQAEADEQEKFRRKQERVRHLFKPLRDYGFGPVTVVLIVICILVAFYSNLGQDMRRLSPLMISLFDLANPGQSTFADALSRMQNGLPEIKQGQVWRLFTPMLIHFGLLHIVFNMLWLRDLGSMIEARQGSGYLVVLVLVFAAISNLAQYLLNGPFFGGMSGVVYGLLAYIWIRGKFDPGSGLFVHPTTVVMMGIWFFICLTGYMGAVANAAHGGGLVVGLIWGYLSSLRYR